MKRRGLQPMHDQHINVTPLIDVVMCLIIFFLICGELVSWDVLGMEIPGARNGQKILDLRGRVVINVMPSKGSPPAIKVLDETIPYPYEALGLGLRKAASENREVKVFVRADKTVPWEYIAPIVRMCSEERVNVNFATLEKGP